MQDLPKSLKRSCFVATGALKMERPSRLARPSRAPARTIARHSTPLPLKQANRRAITWLINLTQSFIIVKVKQNGFKTIQKSNINNTSNDIAKGT